MKFNSEEISLCKQIAEKYRKEIEARQYFYNDHLNKVQWIGEKSLPKQAWAIPPWTISDCLEFFGARKYCFESLVEDDMCLFEVDVLTPDRTGGIRTKGGTALGVLLKAVLAVLEEDK